jgi:predicted secreted protein
MALRGDYLIIKTNVYGSGQVTKTIAETNSVTVDFSAEALETTSQTSALNATFIGGKVSCTVSGDYLYASDGTNFSELFTAVNAGTSLEVEVFRDTTAFLRGEGVITSLSLSGGNSDQLVTGSYSIQCSTNMAT